MKGYKHLTEDQGREVLRLHAIPTPTRTIATTLGVTIHQVRHALHREGVPLSASKEGACYKNADLVRSLVLEGCSLSEIGRRVGTNKRLVKLFLTKHGIPHQPFRQTGENNPAWKGGRMTDKDGYILVHSPDHPEANRHGYVREHRLVMESILGRPLLPEEVVHHRDEDTSNNDPANLRLYPSNAEHLADTLKGKIPDWTEEGFVQVLEASRRGRESPRRSIRKA